MQLRFAVIGLEHRHAYDLAAYLLEAGMECAGYWPQTTDAHVLAGFRKRFPDLPEVADKERLLDDPAIQVIVTAAIPRERAAIAIDAMRRGKDVMADKPGVTTFEQLTAVEAAVRETGRIFSICFSERFLVPSTEKALALVLEGAIGRVVQTVGLGPHRLNRAIRPAWFWDRDAYGGILVDIASHQLDQFILFTDSRHPEVIAATTGSFVTGEGFEDFGEISAQRARGRLCARRLVHAGWIADVGRRAADDTGHRRHDRSAQVHRHRRPRRHRSPVHCRQQGDPAHPLRGGAPDLLPQLRRATCSSAPRRRWRKRIASPCAGWRSRRRQKRKGSGRRPAVRSGRRLRRRTDHLRLGVQTLGLRRCARHTVADGWRSAWPIVRSRLDLRASSAHQKSRIEHDRLPGDPLRNVRCEIDPAGGDRAGGGVLASSKVTKMTADFMRPEVRQRIAEAVPLRRLIVQREQRLAIGRDMLLADVAGAGDALVGPTRTPFLTAGTVTAMSHRLAAVRHHVSLGDAATLGARADIASPRCRCP